jgi:MoaA/NifB/PqqE/SkfB family radical SAM enzyme
MNKIFSIIPVNQDPFIITWDLGPRCNYDCSYCPSHRHDNFSPHTSLEKLKQTTDFVFKYISLIAGQRKNKDFHISFTGGEPTVNPNFIEFSKYIKTQYISKFKDQFNLKIDLTSNGAMSEKTAQAIIDNFDSVTVSYHAEAVEKLKINVRKRIIQFKKSSLSLKINVMFHARLFDDCKELCSWLDKNQIRFIPRLIGEDPSSPFSQAHLYTDEQRQWFKDYWNMNIGLHHRPCCGGRTFGVCSSEGTVETKSINNREFKGWSCSVNWYFLHIEQQTGLIYHHQTCQATLDGRRGSIGSLDNWQAVIDTLTLNIDNKNMPVIICPNKLCGCGLCTPKSEKRQTLLESLPLVVNDIFIFN